jgi:hypothetical protein
MYSRRSFGPPSEVTFASKTSAATYYM